MNTNILASVYNKLPPFAQNAVKKTDIYDTILDVRRDEHYAEKFTSLTITVGESEFDVIVPEWGDDTYWIEHDPYNDKICHEPPVSRKFIEHIDTGDVVWDMGSHYGYYAAIAAQVNKSPENVHVFEMGEEKNWFIEQMNDRLFEGEINVVNKRVSNTSSNGSVSGDDYAAKTSVPDLVKMDIEGAEAPGIKGMSDLIEKERPTLLIETHPNKMYHHFSSNDESLLRKLDEWYSKIKICDRFRNHTAEWETAWREQTNNIHQLAADSQMDAYEETIGYIDPDSYAVFATN